MDRHREYIVRKNAEGSDDQRRSSTRHAMDLKDSALTDPLTDLTSPKKDLLKNYAPLVNPDLGVPS